MVESIKCETILGFMLSHDMLIHVYQISHNLQTVTVEFYTYIIYTPLPQFLVLLFMEGQEIQQYWTENTRTRVDFIIWEVRVPDANCSVHVTFS